MSSRSTRTVGFAGALSLSFFLPSSLPSSLPSGLPFWSFFSRSFSQVLPFLARAFVVGAAEVAEDDVVLVGVAARTPGEDRPVLVPHGALVEVGVLAHVHGLAAVDLAQPDVAVEVLAGGDGVGEPAAVGRPGEVGVVPALDDEAPVLAVRVDHRELARPVTVGQTLPVRRPRRRRRLDALGREPGHAPAARRAQQRGVRIVGDEQTESAVVLAVADLTVADEDEGVGAAGPEGDPALAPRRRQRHRRATFQFRVHEHDLALHHQGQFLARGVHREFGGVLGDILHDDGVLGRIRRERDRESPRLGPGRGVEHPQAAAGLEDDARAVAAGARATHATVAEVGQARLAGPVDVHAPQVEGAGLVVLGAPEDRLPARAPHGIRVVAGMVRDRARDRSPGATARGPTARCRGSRRGRRSGRRRPAGSSRRRARRRSPRRRGRRSAARCRPRRGWPALAVSAGNARAGVT